MLARSSRSGPGTRRSPGPATSCSPTARSGSAAASRRSRRPAPRCVFLALARMPLWVIFELYNKYAIPNWHYVGLPETLLIRYFGYAWSFATIWPAIFETGELVVELRDRRAPAVPRPSAGDGSASAPPAGSRSSPARSCSSCRSLYPSQYLAAPVWLGFIFLLDPINAQRRRRIDPRRPAARDAPGGSSTCSIAGLVCGFLWEFWNYWAGAQMDLHRADAARYQDLRDADRRLRRLSGLRGGVLRDVRRRAPLIWRARRGRSQYNARLRRSSARSDRRPRYEGAAGCLRHRSSARSS